MIDPKRGSKVFQPDIDDAIIGRLVKAIRNCARKRATQPCGILVIDVIKNLAGCLRDQLRENLSNRVEVRIKIQVLLLDIQNERVLGMKKRDGAVALVSFGNEIFAARIPVRVGSENWDL